MVRIYWGDTRWDTASPSGRNSNERIRAEGNLLSGNRIHYFGRIITLNGGTRRQRLSVGWQSRFFLSPQRMRDELPDYPLILRSEPVEHLQGTIRGRTFGAEGTWWNPDAPTAECELQLTQTVFRGLQDRGVDPLARRNVSYSLVRIRDDRWETRRNTFAEPSSQFDYPEMNIPVDRRQYLQINLNARLNFVIEANATVELSPEGSDAPFTVRHTQWDLTPVPV